MGKERFHGKFDARGAARMQRVAREIFAPIYPVLARQIRERLGPFQGLGMDIGCGPGSLALALIGLTGLRMILLDSSLPMLEGAKSNVALQGLCERCLLLPGDVHQLPLADSSIPLIVSRGAIFFWNDLERALAEVFRVLAPGGRTYLGGGFGTAELKNRIGQKMNQEYPGWEAFRDRNLGPETGNRIIQALKAVALPHDLIRDDSGFWIVMRKDPRK